MFSGIKKSKFNKQVQFFREFVVNEKLKYYKHIDIYFETLSFPVSIEAINNDDLKLADAHIFENGDIMILFRKYKDDRIIVTEVNFQPTTDWTIISELTFDKEGKELIKEAELLHFDMGNQKQLFIDYANKFLELYKKYPLCK